MKILGIETSCDETAAAVVKDGREALSNTVVSQIEEHGLYGGVVPEIASRRHVENISFVVRAALESAGTSLSDIDAVAVTYAPGLIGALLAGVNFAKGLAYAEKKPLIPVHHLRGHIAGIYLSDRTAKPPFLALIASGGHSHLVEVTGYTGFILVGRAVDDAAGEAFDKVARTLGLGYPGGAAVSKLAEGGDYKKYALPDPKAERPLDFSFSGLKTAVMNIINSAEMKGETVSKADLAAAFQHRAAEMLASRLITAAKERGLPAAVCGGVAVNTALRARIAELAEQNGVGVFWPRAEFCGDNAAMIASAGYYEYKNGNMAGISLNAYAARDIETG